MVIKISKEELANAISSLDEEKALNVIWNEGRGLRVISMNIEAFGSGKKGKAAKIKEKERERMSPAKTAEDQTGEQETAAETTE